MSLFTRRELFEQSLLATAAATAASLSPGSRLATAADPVAPSAAERLNVAIIGCGGRGRDHAKEFTQMAGVQVRTVCDPDPTRAAAVAKLVAERQPQPPTIVTDLRRILDDRQIQAVSIAAPNHWHALAGIWAMQAGQDVYLEKPVSHTVFEGQQLVATAERTGRLCQTGTQRRSLGSLQAIAEFIQQGKLGTITLARTLVYRRRDTIGEKGNYQVPAQVDYSLWLGPAPEMPLTRPNLHYDWHWQWETGNGELGNNSIHFVDVCRMLIGLTGLGQRVFSIGGRVGYDDAGETPNTQIVFHDFGNLAIIQEVRGLKTEVFSPKFKSGWIIYGTEGIIAEDCLFDLEGNLIRKFTGPAQNHFVNFIDAVRTGERTRLNADIKEGHQSTALCHIGNISHRLGEATTAKEIQQELTQQQVPEEWRLSFGRMGEHLQQNGVDLELTPLTLGKMLTLQQEQFVNNPAANRMLTRTYRQPFALPNVG